MGNAAFVGTMEDLTEEVAQSLASSIEWIVERLSPDGRPFGAREKTPEEEIREYVGYWNDASQQWVGLRGNQQAWATWIRQRVEQTLTYADDFGDGLRTMLNPWQIVSEYAVRESMRLEKMAQEAGAVSGPPVPVPPPAPPMPMAPTMPLPAENPSLEPALGVPA